MFKKKKYIAVFKVKRQSSYELLKRKRVNPLKSIISFRDKSFVFKSEVSTFSKGIKEFFLFDINNIKGHLLFIKNKNCLITPDDVDDVCVKKVVKQLTSNLIDSLKMTLMNMVIGIAIGGLIGYIAGFMVGGG